MPLNLDAANSDMRNHHIKASSYNWIEHEESPSYL